MFTEGDFIIQDRGDEQTYALLVQKLKNGAFRAVAYDTWRNRAFMTSTSGWYPAPTIIGRDRVPAQAVDKITKHLITLRARIKGRLADMQ